MVVTELPMVTLVRLLQFWNAEPPIVVTEFGIVAVVILEPDAKPPGSTMTLEPIVNWVILDVVIVPFEEQFIAFHVNFVKPEQFQKACAPMEVTELPMVALDRLVQPSYLQIALYQKLAP